jgi:hypothetical protein
MTEKWIAMHALEFPEFKVAVIEEFKRFDSEMIVVSTSCNERFNSVIEALAEGNSVQVKAIEENTKISQAALAGIQSLSASLSGTVAAEVAVKRGAGILGWISKKIICFGQNAREYLASAIVVSIFWWILTNKVSISEVIKLLTRHE